MNYCTVTPSVCVFVTPPPVAVTVSVVLPVTVLDAAFSVSILLPPPGEGMLVGASVAVTPFGNPLTESVIADLNPFATAVDRVTGIDPPLATITFAPPSVSVNVGPVTVRLSACVLVTPPPVAFTVSE